MLFFSVWRNVREDPPLSSSLTLSAVEVYSFTVGSGKTLTLTASLKEIKGRSWWNKEGGLVEREDRHIFIQRCTLHSSELAIRNDGKPAFVAASLKEWETQSCDCLVPTQRLIDFILMNTNFIHQWDTIRNISFKRAGLGSTFCLFFVLFIIWSWRDWWLLY